MIQDWADYEFEDEYQTRIRSRRNADHLEDGFLGYFFRYQMNLALPLPRARSPRPAQPTPTSGWRTSSRRSRPSRTPPRGRKTRRRFTSASTGRVRGKTSTGLRARMRPAAAGAFGGNAGPTYGGLDTVAPPPAMKNAPLQFNPYQNKDNPNTQAPVDIEHLLLRFVDAAVEPGLTYQYQIRLVMKNPNWGHKKDVSKPADAEKELLLSPWVQTDPITVPSETYLFATDWQGYSSEDQGGVREGARELQRRLEAKEHQAVVETLTWMEQVRTGDGGKREPVGAWVVADYPVARGEFIGRKQYVKLPLWSSENMSVRPARDPRQGDPEERRREGTGAAEGLADGLHQQQVDPRRLRGGQDPHPGRQQGSHR